MKKSGLSLLKSRVAISKTEVFKMALFISIIFFGCATSPPHSEPKTFGTAATFEEAVQECYILAAETLFYSYDGELPTAHNVIPGPNEMPGICSDYSLEFAYYWNEVKNYDEIFGRAYFGRWEHDIFSIRDYMLVPDGSSRVREETGSFWFCVNSGEVDGVYRDAFLMKVLYIGEPLLHYGFSLTDYHFWIIIKHNDNWYYCDPTYFDTWPDFPSPPLLMQNIVLPL